MRVLVVKLTSMGDVLHLMPALTDLQHHHPDLVVDWMVEDSFSELPSWHPSVDKVVRVSTRRWRRLNRVNISEFFDFLNNLRGNRYDVIVDAQGLMKSAIFARLGKLNKGGRRVGFSGDSIKESPAAWFYQNKIAVPRQQHAIERLRQLFSGAFSYQHDSSVLDYGVTRPAVTPKPKSVMFFHGTTWPTKHLPIGLWHELCDLANADGFEVLLAWGSQTEKARAERLATNKENVSVLPKQNLNGVAQSVVSVAGAIAVDTGLGHMAAGFGVPCVSIYGSTDAALTGAVGDNQVSVQSRFLCSPCLLKECPKLTADVSTPPCYQASADNPELSAADIWQRLYQQIN